VRSRLAWLLPAATACNCVGVEDTRGARVARYTDNTCALKVAHCTSTLCTAATATTLDPTGDVAVSTCMTMGTDGFGLISYYANTNVSGDLKVAHCALTGCPAYARNR
jgi:hypothetical protein